MIWKLVGRLLLFAILAILLIALLGMGLRWATGQFSWAAPIAKAVGLTARPTIATSEATGRLDFTDDIEAAKQAEVDAQASARQAEQDRLAAKAKMAAAVEYYKWATGKRGPFDVFDVDVYSVAGGPDKSLSATVVVTPAGGAPETAEVEAGKKVQFDAAPGVTYKVEARVKDDAREYTCQTVSDYEGGYRRVDLWVP